MTPQPLRIGLTGGIGSGKSTVAARLAALGCLLIDTDAIARSLTEPGGAAMDAIRAAFGDEMIAPDGSLDRARMREAAFAGDDARRRLEAILHPLIGEHAQRHGDSEAARAAPLVVFDVPLLVESGRWRQRVDRVWVVDCGEPTQLARVMARSGWSEAAVRAVMARQASRAARRAAADAIIHNDGITLDALERQVDALFAAATTAAAGAAAAPADTPVLAQGSQPPPAGTV